MCSTRQAIYKGNLILFGRNVTSLHRQFGNIIWHRCVPVLFFQTLINLFPFVESHTVGVPKSMATFAIPACNTIVFGSQTTLQSEDSGASTSRNKQNGFPALLLQLNSPTATWLTSRTGFTKMRNESQYGAHLWGVPHPLLGVRFVLRIYP